ncbi:alpha/beta hydrolase, partial [Pseudomonas syringae]
MASSHAPEQANTWGVRDRLTSVSAMADQVDATIRELGLTQCIVVGHSMTGKVALVLASRRPEYLAGLILVAPPPPTPQPTRHAARDRPRAYTKTRFQAGELVDQARAPPPRDVTPHGAHP